jgi:hypothetical protein
MNGKTFKGMSSKIKERGKISDKEEYSEGRKNMRLIITIQP